jgi:hypothetical protein
VLATVTDTVGTLTNDVVGAIAPVQARQHAEVAIMRTMLRACVIAAFRPSGSRAPSSLWPSRAAVIQRTSRAFRIQLARPTLAVARATKIVPRTGPYIAAKPGCHIKLVGKTRMSARPGAPA